MDPQDMQGSVQPQDDGMTPQAPATPDMPAQDAGFESPAEEAPAMPEENGEAAPEEPAM